MLSKEKFEKEYIEGNKAVYFETKELATQFLTIAKNFGYKWRDGKIYIDHPRCHNDEYCYRYSSMGEGFGFSDRAFFKKKGVTIIEFDLGKIVLTKEEMKKIIENAKQDILILADKINEKNAIIREMEMELEKNEANPVKICMKEVKKVGVRPVLEFICKTCGCVWTDGNYEAKEPLNRVVTINLQCKVLTSDCPTCKMPSSNYSEIIKEKNND